MKLLLLYALLLLLPASLFAEELITIETTFIESGNEHITHDLTKLMRHKGIDTLSAPKVTVKSGHEGVVEIVTYYQPASVPPSTFKPVPLGVIVHVTPYFKDDTITYNAQFTLSDIISKKSENGQLQSEISSHDKYISGALKDGKDVWFDYKDPTRGKTITVCLRFKHEAL